MQAAGGQRPALGTLEAQHMPTVGTSTEEEDEAEVRRPCPAHPCIKHLPRVVTSTKDSRDT